MRSSNEVNKKIVELDKELKTALANEHTLDNEKLLIQKDIINLSSKKKDIEISLSKSMYIVRQLNIDLSIARKLYWFLHNEEL